MPRLTKFEEYRDRYSDSFVLEKTDDGILLMRMHTNGDSVKWPRAYHDTSNLLADVAGDRDVRIVIYTGTGENFNNDWRLTDQERATSRVHPNGDRLRYVEEMGWYGRNRHNNMLDIDAIMIAAVNGPVSIHSELPFMCDIVLASEDAWFQDGAHFVANFSPGDGVQNVWPRAIGWHRWQYWQLLGQKITAQQAYEWGAVNEVLPKDRVLDRAWEIARYLSRYSTVNLRNTRRTFVQELKRAAVNDLSLGQHMELLCMTSIPHEPTLWDESILPH
jgi:enoyl-CoA hydratase/carnithine racemase